MTDILKPTDIGYDPYEKTARYIETPFGQEIVTMQQLWWDYYD
jgi:hypothetical protein